MKLQDNILEYLGGITMKKVQEIINKFGNKYKKELQATEHQSPYHLEGDVWTHTMMVTNEVLKENPDDYIMLYTSLLHDIGKPEAKAKKKNGGIHFGGHPGISTLKALDFLLNEDLEDDEIIKILYLINYHDHLMQKRKPSFWDNYFSSPFTNDLLSNLIQFNYYDKKGSISVIKQQINYPSVDVYKSDFYNADSQITVLIGPPGSGKSTYLSKYLQTDTDIVVISRDKMMVEILSEKYGTNDYNKIWQNATKEEHQMITNLLMKNFSKAVKQGKQIVIDMTNVSIKSRRKWQVGKVGVKYIVFLTSLDELQQRVAERKEQKIKNWVLMNFVKWFEMPLPTEGNIVDVNFVIFDKKEGIKEFSLKELIQKEKFLNSNLLPQQEK